MSSVYIVTNDDGESVVAMAECKTCKGKFLMEHVGITDDLQLWHDGSRFGGDIICCGPFYLEIQLAGDSAKEGERG